MAYRMKGMEFGEGTGRVQPGAPNIKSVTPEMMQHLDDQITKMKKLGNKGATQVLLDKKSKLMDELANLERSKPSNPTETDAEIERREDAMGVTTNIKMPKVHKDGPKNKVVQQKSSGVPYTTGKKSFNFKNKGKFNFGKSNDYSQKGIDHRKYSDLEKHDDDK